MFPSLTFVDPVRHPVELDVPDAVAGDGDDLVGAHGRLVVQVVVVRHHVAVVAAGPGEKLLKMENINV